MMLDIIEEKLWEMKSMVQLAKEENFNINKVESINEKINILEEQARELDEESRKFEFIS